MLQLKTDHGDVFKVSGFGTIYDDFPLLEEDVVKQRMVVHHKLLCSRKAVDIFRPKKTWFN